MLFPPTDLFGFKPEIILEIPILLIGNETNDKRLTLYVFEKKCYLNNLH